MSLSTLWQDCLSQLQDQVSPMDLSTWLRPLQADVISQDQVVLYASNMFVKSWVENHYLAQIHQICQALAKNPNLQIIVKIIVITAVFKAQIMKLKDTVLLRKTSFPAAKKVIGWDFVLLYCRVGKIPILLMRGW